VSREVIRLGHLPGEHLRRFVLARRKNVAAALARARRRRQLDRLMWQVKWRTNRALERLREVFR
jgi:hypothetical protein